MQDGIIKPGPKTIAKLEKFKERYQYNQLRASGAPVKEAKKFSRTDFAEAMKRAAQYIEGAKRVANALSKVQKRKINYEWILYHMYHGDYDIEDWDSYVTALSG